VVLSLYCGWSLSCSCLPRHRAHYLTANNMWY
jgi:hypothetical protein